MPATQTLSRSVSARHVSYPLARAFSISRGTKTSADVVEVTIRAGDVSGRGEGVPYPRYGETVEASLAEIEAVRPALESGLDREGLLDRMKPGAARAAVDAALWDLEAKQAGRPVWQIAGLPEPRAILTAETVVLGTPEEMARAAAAAASPLLKLKLGGPEDMTRVKAVHEAAPQAQLILDANEALSPEQFDAITREAVALGVVLIEQPFPEGKDALLRRRASPVAICADESVHTVGDLERIAHGYDAINVKLDKAGGLTAALKLVTEARRTGLYVMVGCMLGSSLSMAPAVLLAQVADAADLDGPIWLAADIAGGLSYEKGFVSPPGAALWGS